MLKITRSGIAVNGTPSHSFGVPLAIWDYTVLSATRNKWTHSALTPARQTGTRFTYPGGMEGWVDLGEWLRRYKIVSFTLHYITYRYGFSARRRSPIQVLTRQYTVCSNSQPVDRKSFVQYHIFTEP